MTRKHGIYSSSSLTKDSSLEASSASYSSGSSSSESPKTFLISAVDFAFPFSILAS